MSEDRKPYRAPELVRLPEDDPRAQALSEEITRVQVGHKDGRVVLNLFGTSQVEPSYIAWSPAQAREVAGHLLRCAALAEGLE